jgi:lysozyme family protein
MTNLNDFRRALQFTLKWEGGYINDPADPGGETKYGIAKRSHPSLDIANLTPEQAATIYANEYWDACGCDSIPFPFCVAVFDTAVNCGVSKATQWMKEAPDVTAYLGLRKQFYYNQVNSIPTKIKFLKGWLARVDDLRKLVDIATQSQDQQARLDVPRWGSLG